MEGEEITLSIVKLDDKIKLVKMKKNELKVAHNIFCKSSKQTTFTDFKNRWQYSTIMYLIKKPTVTLNGLVFDFRIGYVFATTRNEIGYFILPEYQRKGYGTLAVNQLIKIEKREYYWAMIPKDKPHSVKFIQSIGFNQSGTVFAKEIGNV